MLFTKGRVIRRIFKTLLFLAGGIITLLLIVSMVFSLYRDDIGRKLVLMINDVQHGEISFSEISLSPFIHFPDMSVKLKDVYYVYADPFDSLHRVDTLAAISRLYVAADVGSLLSGNVLVPKITISEGTIALVEYRDSTFNLLHAIGAYDTLEEYPMRNEKDIPAVDERFKISLNGIALRNVDLIYSKTAAADTMRVGLNNLQARLDYHSPEISGDFRMDLALKDLGLISEKQLGELPVKIKSSFAFNEDSRKLSIEDTELEFRSALFNLSGYLTLTDGVIVDLSMDARDIDLSFFKLWLSEKGLKNLKSGKAFLSGTMAGTFNGQIPRMNFNFGVKNVNLLLPGVGHSISNLGLDGVFQSGKKTDFSEASLVISNLDGQLPGGYVRGNFSMEDFSAPNIKLLWDMKADIAGFDEVLNIQGVSRLNGKITFFDQAEGSYDPVAKEWHEKENESLLLLDSVSMDVAGFGTVTNLHGSVNRSHDTLSIQELRFVSGNSDFRIDGAVRNLLTVFTENDELITADLTIVSDTFDLPVFLSFDPRIGESFPYRITGVDLALSASTSRDQLLVFEYNPEVLFEIGHLKATIENLFPEVTIHQGAMVMAEKEARIHLSFQDFSLNVANGEIAADVIYYSPALEPDQVIVDAQIKGLDPGLMFYGSKDSVPGIARGVLNANVHADMALGADTLDFEHIAVDLLALDYKTSMDTFDIAGLGLEAMEVHYTSPENPFASLSATIDLRAKTVRSNHFILEDIGYSMDAKNGNFTVYPENIRIFGKEGEGVYKLSPFTDNPAYSIKYKVNKFPVESFLASFLVDTVLTGFMDLDLDIAVSGFDDNNLLSFVNGFVDIQGKGLTLYGVDLDKIIEKYQKSQKFNLVDVGAVALAGPFGLAITKGSQFARLALGDYGKATQIVNLVSEWECINGRLHIRDVAFATEKNLLASAGWIDLPGDSLNITIAVLNANNCNVVSQSVYGKLSNPEHSEVNIVSALLGPVTNLFDGQTNKNCKPFYTGRLKHPLAGNKNK